MQRFSPALLIASLFLTFAHAEDGKIPAFFVLDDGGEQPFDMQAWQRSIEIIKGGEFIRTYRLDRDDTALEKAKNDAAKDEASDNVVLLMTTTTPDKNSREFRSSFAELKKAFRTNPDFKGFGVLAEWPMCALVRQGPGIYASGVRGTVLFVLDHPKASLACYPMVQEYFATPPGPDGERAAPISVDGTTIAMQTILPPIEIARKLLADKAAFKQRELVEHPTNVYAPGEEIFMYAHLENVGRKDAGTPMARFEIGLDVEVRDSAGKIVKAFPNLHTYEGESPPPFPASLDYFTNFATAGIAIEEPGDYAIAYTFHDRSRQDSPPVTAEFDVTIK